MSLRHRFQDYLFRAWVANRVALIIVIAIWFFTPSLLVQVFDWNAGRISWFWYGFIYPHLWTEIQLASEAVSAAHDAILAGVGFASFVSGDEAETAARLEATARILLVGEVLLVVIELSVILRVAYRLLKIFTRAKHNSPHPA